MEPDDREAARLLEPLRRFEPGGLNRVDVDRALRTGRRTVRTRRAAGGIAGLVGVLGMAAVVTFPLTSPTTPTRPEFSVTVQQFDIGPAAGFTPLTYETGVTRQRAVLTAPDLDDTDAVVTVYAPDRLPDVDGVDWRPDDGEPAPDVDGATARWLPEPVLREGAVELAWRWRDDAWGFVSLRGPDADRDRALTVARGVIPDARLPVDTPALLPGGLVPEAELTGTTRSIGTVGRPELINEVVYTVGGDPDARITLTLRRPGGEEPDYPTTVGGRPAHIDDDAVTFLDGSGLSVAVSPGLDLGRSLRDLAAAVEVNPGFTLPTTIPLVSPGQSSSSATDDQTSGDDASPSTDDGGATSPGSDGTSESGQPTG